MKCHREYLRYKKEMKRKIHCVTTLLQFKVHSLTSNNFLHNSRIGKNEFPQFLANLIAFSCRKT